jgi:beta-glucosidase
MVPYDQVRIFSTLVKQVSDSKSSYNRVNGIYVSDDARLVNGVVRREWGFDGLVVSDWMGVYSTAESVNAGVDVDLPGPTKWRGDKLLQAIADGAVSEETVNSSARRVLELAQRLGCFENPEEALEVALKNADRDLFIRDAGAQGMVLLKNENSKIFWILICPESHPLTHL